MSSPGFKRWGASTGASGASSYAFSKSDGTQYVSPSEEAKSKKGSPKPAKKPEKQKTSGPKPGKAAVAYSSPASSPKPASKPSPTVSRSTPEVVSGGLASTTYEKQPNWAFAERDKNSSGQYRDGMFQDSTNPNNTSTTASKSAYSSSTTSSYKPAAKTTSTTSSSTPGWAQKPVQSTFTKPAASPKPVVASYQVGGSGNAQAAYGSDTGTYSSSGVTKSGLATTTYEKQPDWAYAERSKNANGQYKDSMFQGGGAKVQYGSHSASPTQLRAGGNLR